jgi:hypothetical protein
MSFGLHLFSNLLFCLDIQDWVGVWLNSLSAELGEMTFDDFWLDILGLIPTHYVVLCSTTDCVVLESV